MAITVGDLVVRLRADAKQFATAIDTASARMKKAGQTMTSVGSRLSIGLSVPLAAIGYKAAKASMEFETAFAHIKGLVGASEQDITRYKDAIAAIGPVAGKTGGELAKAAFFITSAGLKGERAAAGVETLEAAAKGAAAGLGDTATVADAATSSMNAYGEANLSAKKAVAILAATVREGKAEAESIAPTLGKLLPIAADLGISFDQVGASLAAMTRLGSDAATSSTYLKSTMMQIKKPAKEQRDALAEIGMTFEELRKQLREKGLISVLRTLKDAFGENEEAMARVFPNSRALVGVLSMVGENAEETQKIFDSLAKTTEEDLNKAFEAVGETSRLKLDRSLAAINSAMRQLGDAILPAILPWVDRFTALVTKLSDGFAGLSPWLKEIIVAFGLFATVAGPLLVVLGAVTSTVGSLMTGITTLTSAVTAHTAATAAQNVAVSANVKAMASAVAQTSLLNVGLVALAAGIGVLIGNAIRPYVNELLGLNEALDLVAEKHADLVSGLAESQTAYTMQLQAYDQLRKRLGLLNDEWRVSADFTRENAARLSELTERAIAHARTQTKLTAAVAAQNKALLTKAEIHAMITAKLKESDEAAKAHIETLKEQYQLLSKKDIAANLDQMVKDYQDLKDAGIDQVQLAEAFSQQLADQVALAKQNKVELPEGIRAMAAELKEKAEPALKSALDKIATELPKEINAMPGKIIPGMVKIGGVIAEHLEGGFGKGFEAGKRAIESLEPVLRGGFGKGIRDGVDEGEQYFNSFKERVQGEALVFRVVGDWSEFDAQAQFRSAGYVPETGSP